MTNQLTFLLEEPLAKVSASADLEKDCTTTEETSCLSILEWLTNFKPKWIVWENVVGVLSSNGGRDFGTFLTALGKIGYGFAYRVLDAQYFGVPQRRRRVFVVGCLGDWRSAGKVLFKPESLSGESSAEQRRGKELPPQLRQVLLYARTGNERVERSCYVQLRIVQAMDLVFQSIQFRPYKPKKQSVAIPIHDQATRLWKEGREADGKAMALGLKRWCAYEHLDQEEIDTRWRRTYALIPSKRYEGQATDPKRM